jgi:hypothetical protein
MSTGRVRAALAVFVVGAVVGTGVALAAKKPIKGALYSGLIHKVERFNGKTYRSTLPISFKVSSNGKRVSNFTMSSGYPIYCQGGGFGALQPASAKITNRGTFKVKLPLFFAPAHQHQGFVIVTGKFGANGKESGKVTTAFSKATGCNGTSKYSTTG